MSGREERREERKNGRGKEERRQVRERYGRQVRER